MENIQTIEEEEKSNFSEASFMSQHFLQDVKSHYKTKMRF